MKKIFVVILFICLFASKASAKALVTDSLRDSMENVISLDEVVIKKRYSYAKRVGNKFLVSFKGSPFYKDKTIAEGLTMCPLIDRKDDAFSIFGKEETEIYIDGKPSVLNGQEIYALLNSKMTSDIDHIEIIPNPSSKYDASKHSGIINIILSRNKHDTGLMSMLNGGITKAKKWSEKGSGMFTMGLRNVNMNLLVNGVHSNMSRTSTTNYNFQNVSAKEESSRFKQKGSPILTMFSTEWTAKQNNIGFAYNFSTLHVNSAAEQLLNFNKIFDKSSIISNKNHVLQLYDEYSHGSTKINFLYNFYYRNNKVMDDYAGEETTINLINKEQFHINNLKLDFDTQLDSTSVLCYGASGNILNMKSDYHYNNLVQLSHYNEKTIGIYVSGEKHCGLLTMSLGLRYEYTGQTFLGNKKSYNNLFPNLSIEMSNEGNTYYLNYQKTISRVPYNNLTTSPIYFSPDSKIIGNPSLLPAITHNLNLGFNRGNLDIELYNKYIKNDNFMYSFMDGSTTISSYRNLKAENQLGVNLNYILSISEIFMLKLSGSSFYDCTHFDNNEKTYGWDNYLSSNLAIRFDKQGKFDANINYWALFPQKETGVYWRNRACCSADFDYNIIKHKLKLTLRANDIFNQDIARLTRTYNGNEARYNNTFDKQSLSLSIQYMFSNKKRIKNNKRNAIDDEGRIPTE